MNNCSACGDGFQCDIPNKVICDGNCRRPFHTECASFCKKALMHYREMPNLQWFCDGCIVQIRSSNLSSANMSECAHEVPRQLKVNRASSPIYIEHPLIAAKRKRIPNPKSNKKSVFLSNVEHNIGNAKDSLRSSPSESEMQFENHLVEPFAIDLSKSMYTSVITQNEVSLPKPQHNAADSELTSNKTMETSGREIPPASSIAELLAKSSAEVRNTTISPSPDNSVQAQRLVFPFNSQKVVYVTNFDPSVTENKIVNYLLSKKVISSPEEVLCEKVVPRNVNLDNVSFVSFKITVNSEIFESVVKLWPQNVIVCELEKNTTLRSQSISLNSNC